MFVFKGLNKREKRNELREERNEERKLDGRKYEKKEIEFQCFGQCISHEKKSIFPFKKKIYIDKNSFGIKP